MNTTTACGTTVVYISTGVPSTLPSLRPTKSSTSTLMEVRLQTRRDFLDRLSQYVVCHTTTSCSSSPITSTRLETLLRMHRACRSCTPRLTATHWMKSPPSRDVTPSRTCSLSARRTSHAPWSSSAKDMCVLKAKTVRTTSTRVWLTVSSHATTSSCRTGTVQPRQPMPHVRATHSVMLPDLRTDSWMCSLPT